MGDEIVLFYIGNGVTFVPGIPARDLTQSEVDASGRTIDELVAYRDAYARSPSSPITTINHKDGINNAETSAAASALRKRRDEKEK